MRREREEPRLLLREDLRDGLIALLGMGALVRHLVAPPPKLRIEVVHVAKGPAVVTPLLRLSGTQIAGLP
jgi:hypothetical protein